MMSRNTGEGNSNVTQQQPTESYNQQFGTDNRSMSNRGNLGGYGGSSGGYPEQQGAARRYTLSAGVNDADLGQQVPTLGSGMSLNSGGGGGDLMGNHSQRSHQSQQQIPGGNIGYRGDLRASDSPSNLNSMPQGYPYGAELSPTHLAHRMSLGFYPMSAGSAGSPNYGTIGDTMDLSGRGLPSVSVPAAAGTLSQADREEELLLNLLIARRQRGRMAGDGKGRSQASLADDLMRLRQSRSGSANGQRRSGSIPQIPGMPPLYAESMTTGAGIVPPNMYPTMEGYGRNSGISMKSEAFPSHLQMQQMQNASERIDRSPGRFQLSDARMSEMRELSERSAGFKRGMGSMGMGVMMGQVSGMGMGGMGYPIEGLGDYHHVVGDMREPNQQAFKKKRTHKKKPLDMVNIVSSLAILRCIFYFDHTGTDCFLLPYLYASLDVLCPLIIYFSLKSVSVY
jgi:hypothetical protein